jgi:hypothetical protein
MTYDWTNEDSPGWHAYDPAALAQRGERGAEVDQLLQALKAERQDAAQRLWEDG